MLQVHELGLRGIRSLAVARTDDEGKWRMLGILTFLDPPRCAPELPVQYHESEQRKCCTHTDLLLHKHLL